MVEIKAKQSGVEEMVQVNPIYSFGLLPRKEPRTKKRIRRIAEPHLEARRVNGKVYYRYRRGIDKPIYLGDADKVLTAVMFYSNNNKCRGG